MTSADSNGIWDMATCRARYTGEMQTWTAYEKIVSMMYHNTVRTDNIFTCQLQIQNLFKLMPKKMGAYENFTMFQQFIPS